MEDIAVRALATRSFGPDCRPRIETGGVGKRLLFPLRDRSAIEVTLEADRKRILVGFQTLDRGFNDQVEDQLLASGESFAELLAMELEELQAGTTQFQVDHHFDRDMRAFRFSTYLHYDDGDLASESLRNRLALLAAGFRGVLRELVEFYG